MGLIYDLYLEDESFSKAIKERLSYEFCFIVHKDFFSEIVNKKMFAIYEKTARSKKLDTIKRNLSELEEKYKARDFEEYSFGKPFDSLAQMIGYDDFDNLVDKAIQDKLEYNTFYQLLKQAYKLLHIKIFMTSKEVIIDELEKHFNKGQI